MPHLLQGVRGDLLAPPKNGAVVLGGEALQLGAQGLLLLRDDAEGARLGARRGWEADESSAHGPPPPCPPAPRGWGQPQRCVGPSGLHPGGHGRARGAAAQCCMEGLLRARGWAVLTTADMSSFSLYQLQDTGREEEELPRGSEVPAAPGAPVPPALIPLHWGGGGYPAGTALSAPPPTARVTAWGKLRVFEKHQGCLQKQIKYVGIGHLPPSACFFCGSAFLWGAVGRNTHGSWGPTAP